RATPRVHRGGGHRGGDGLAPQGGRAADRPAAPAGSRRRAGGLRSPQGNARRADRAAPGPAAGAGQRPASCLKQKLSWVLLAGFCPGRQNVPEGQSLSSSQRWVHTQFWRMRQKQLLGATQSGVTAYTEQASPNWLRLSPHAPITASANAAPRDSRG